MGGVWGHAPYGDIIYEYGQHRHRGSIITEMWWIRAMPYSGGGTGVHVIQAPRQQGNRPELQSTRGVDQ